MTRGNMTDGGTETNAAAILLCPNGCVCIRLGAVSIHLTHEELHSLVAAGKEALVCLERRQMGIGGVQ